jgi:diaminopimelate decarboxylase
MIWHSTTPAEFEALAQEFGTPFYLYDAGVVNTRIRDLQAALGGQAGIYYAVKANPNLELLRAVRPVADGVDVSSSGELEQALLAGFDGGQVSFAGPAKTNAELESAIRANVGCISVESIREIEACAQIGRQLGKRPRILLRVNPLMPNKAYGLKMGGRPVQFGIDEEDLIHAETCVLTRQEQLDFVGIHVYAGSQCFEASGVIEGTRNTLRIARELESRSGLRCRKINLGGGFGVSHTAGGREMDIHELSAELVPMLRAFKEDSAFECEMFFELGRHLTADAGIYVTRVVSSKSSRGKAFFACDGGLHHHLAAAGTFGAAMRVNFELCNLTRPEGDATVCNIAGPSCNPTDLLGVEATLPHPNVGDLIGVLRSGSYGFTASPLLFLGRPTPTELVKRNGEVIVGRRSREMKDFN